MKFKYKSWQFITGISILIILTLSYFIKIPVESGADYVSYAKLLSLLIFYNPFVLGVYVLIVIILLSKSIIVNENPFIPSK